MIYQDGVRALPVGELIEKLRRVQEREAVHAIACNVIGNLMIRDTEGNYVGYIDLGDGEIDFWEDAT